MPRRRKNGADERPPPIDGGEDAPPRGHNIAGISGDRLRSFIERIERLEDEKSVTTTDIREVYAEAKGTGFDTKTIRRLVKERRMDADDLAEQETMLAIYKKALGVFADTPLGTAAISRVTPGTTAAEGQAQRPSAS